MFNIIDFAVFVSVCIFIEGDTDTDGDTDTYLTEGDSHSFVGALGNVSNQNSLSFQPYTHFTLTLKRQLNWLVNIHNS